MTSGEKPPVSRDVKGVAHSYGARQRPPWLLAGLICVLVLISTCNVVSAASRTGSAGTLSARLTKTSFTSSQASSVKLIYKLSVRSKGFAYLLAFKNGEKWQTIKSVKKVGSFKGSYTTTVKKLFAGKPINVGSYRLRLSANGGSKLLTFKILADGGIAHATQVSAGYAHTCAVLSDGTIKCWGYNLLGWLGSGQATTGIGPVQVKGITSATQVAAGHEHSCALLSGGTVKCWGGNRSGQLGDGKLSHGHDLGAIGDFNPTAVGVKGIANATQIAAGGYHNCALLPGGTVECWGSAGGGLLGDGKTSHGHSDAQGFDFSPTPVRVNGITNATQIAAAYDHTCALLPGGTVKCWGFNGRGELGDGTTTSRTAPVEVSGIASAVQIDAGYSHTCALLSGGVVKCWGYNADGELGDSTTTDRATPVQVSGIAAATQVSAGFSHTCALVSGGAIRCWGGNGSGELGNGTKTSTSIPVAVRGITNATKVDAGEEDTCALLSGGAIKCWGLNHLGQLGDGTTKDRASPVVVRGL